MEASGRSSARRAKGSRARSTSSSYPTTRPSASSTNVNRGISGASTVLRSVSEVGPTSPRAVFPGPRGWRGLGVRQRVLLFELALLALNLCHLAVQTVTVCRYDGRCYDVDLLLLAALGLGRHFSAQVLAMRADAAAAAAGGFLSPKAKRRLPLLQHLRAYPRLCLCVCVLGMCGLVSSVRLIRSNPLGSLLVTLPTLLTPLLSPWPYPWPRQIAEQTPIGSGPGSASRLAPLLLRSVQCRAAEAAFIAGVSPIIASRRRFAHYASSYTRCTAHVLVFAFQTAVLASAAALVLIRDQASNEAGGRISPTPGRGGRRGQSPSSASSASATVRCLGWEEAVCGGVLRREGEGQEESATLVMLQMAQAVGVLCLGVLVSQLQQWGSACALLASGVCVLGMVHLAQDESPPPRQ